MGYLVNANQKKKRLLCFYSFEYETHFSLASHSLISTIVVEISVDQPFFLIQLNNVLLICVFYISFEELLFLKKKTIDFVVIGLSHECQASVRSPKTLHSRSVHHLQSMSPDPQIRYNRHSHYELPPFNFFFGGVGFWVCGEESTTVLNKLSCLIIFIYGFLVSFVGQKKVREKTATWNNHKLTPTT